MKRPIILFFDVNESLLNLEGLSSSVASVLNGKKELVPLWFSTMLHYSLVSTSGRQYADFGLIGAACLQMVASSHGITVSEAEAKEAISPILSLPPHPEVEEALAILQDAGYRMVSLTNSSNKGLAAQFDNAGLGKYFEAQLSIEDIGKYKPHSDVYDWAARKMGVAPPFCMMIAAHGWDIAGAIWAGWRGAFIARAGKELYPLAPRPEINEPDLLQIANKLVAMGK